MALISRICKQCGVGFQGGPRAWYCPECRKERERERAAKYRKSSAKRKLGSTDLCAMCGEPYIVASGTQQYCSTCAPIALRAKDAEQSLAHYNRHKDVINPRRNARRRAQGKRCPICGKDFYAPTRALYCSEECRADARKALCRTIYDKRRTKK